MTSASRMLEQTAGGLRCAAASDVGMRRTSNQDSMTIALADTPEMWASQGHLFVVADGMGAHAAGELASQIATDNIPHSYRKRKDQPPSEAIAEALREANGMIHNKGSNSVDFQGMGTTCSCLLLLPQGALAAHVGDSRVYRLRDDVFEQLTFDHSLVWEMAAAGHASEDEVPAYVPKNVITRSLGPHPTVAVDVEGPFTLRAGDRFLLCSDGLSGPLSPELIGMVLASLPPVEVAGSLVDLANLLGGPDNITAVVVEVVDPAQLGRQEVDASVNPAHSNGRSAATRSSVHPLFWICISLCIGLTSVLAALGYLMGAVFSGVGFGVASIVALLKKSQSHSCEGEAGHIGRRGKAPYRCHPCAPSAANIAKLGDIVRQLEDLEDQRDWQFDWQPILAVRNKAHEAIAQGDYQAAVAAYCSAVRQLMQALRSQPLPPSSDSNVDL